MIPAMQSHELLREVFQRCSPKQVAAELGLSLSMIYKWAEPPERLFYFSLINRFGLLVQGRDNRDTTTGLTPFAK